MNESLLQVKDLSLTITKNGQTFYPVQDLSFEIYPSEIIGIVGESGSGKTLAMQSILGLLNDEINVCGEAIFQKQNLLHLSLNHLSAIRGKHIAMIFQDPKSSLNPTLKIKKQMIEGLVHHRICTKQEAKQKAMELLQMVCLPNPKEILNLYPHELSGGMRQRVLIAMAISCNPQLLIADEPTTALDAAIQSEILSLLKDIQEKRKMSIVLISHDISAIRMVCDRILVMYGGRIVEFGTNAGVLKKPKHPYTKLLLESVPTLDKDKDTNPLKTIQGSFTPISKPDKTCPFHPRCPHAMKVCAAIPPPLINNVQCWIYDNTISTDQKPD